MNIFALHYKPRKCARWHVDKHVVKMLLETVQLLYTAHWSLAYPDLKLCKSPIALARAHKLLDIPPSMTSAPPTESTGTQYRPCHINHPCSKWTRCTLGNYKWLSQLALELAREFRHRFHNIHSCQIHAEWLHSHPPPNIPPYPRTEFVMAMDNQYKISKNPLISYRNYYRTAKANKGLIKYTARHVPHWL